MFKSETENGYHELSVDRRSNPNDHYLDNIVPKDLSLNKDEFCISSKLNSKIPQSDRQTNLNPEKNSNLLNIYLTPVYKTDKAQSIHSQRYTYRRPQIRAPPSTLPRRKTRTSAGFRRYIPDLFWACSLPRNRRGGLLADGWRGSHLTWSVCMHVCELLDGKM